MRIYVGIIGSILQGRRQLWALRSLQRLEEMCNVFHSIPLFLFLSRWALTPQVVAISPLEYAQLGTVQGFLR